MWMISLALAAATASAPVPDMTVSMRGLDLARPEDAAALAGRIRAEADAWCVRHHAIVAPDARDACEPEMRRRAARALPPAERSRFVRAGGMRTLNRR